MIQGLFVLVAVVLAVFMSYHRLRLWAWSLIAAVFLLFWEWSTEAAPFTSMTVWVGYLLVVLPLNLLFIRRYLFSASLFRLFKRVLPPVSQTEQEALDAGTVWWEGELFSGRPNWRQLHEYPPARLSEEEQAFIDGPVQTLCQMLDDWQITAELHDLPESVWQYLKQERFFGMIIPKQYGGLAFSAQAHSAVVSKIASRSISAAVTVMVPNSLGPAELLMHYGTEAQREHYLPRLAVGEDIPAFALTGPFAGSDAASMPDRGVVCEGELEGEPVIGIRLNWSKRYITLGPIATVLGLAFKLEDPQHLLGDKVERGITCALIPTNTQGVTIGERHAPLDMAFMNGPNYGKDVFIPLDWIIGGKAGIGQGWRMLMESLAAGRSISLPSLSAGAGKLACRYVGAYARIREQFKLPIGRFEGVEEVLARIAGNSYAMDAVRSMTCIAVDMGEKPAVASAIAKYHLTERMRQVINDGMDILGGRGIVMGPNNFLARGYQAIPIAITVEGANILTRSLIIFGQGAIRCHPYILKEMQAVAHANPRQGLRDFDRALFAHIGFTISNMVRCLFLGLMNARFSRVPGGPMRRYYQQLSRMSTALAMSADLAMLVMGGNLKRREKLSARLGDVLSQLYIASAALKRFAEQGQPEADIPLVQWVCEDSLFRIQEALHGFLRNFPNRPLAWLMRLMIFPRGRFWSQPRDSLGRSLSERVMSPGEARDRLTEGVFISAQPDDSLGRVEDALQKLIEAEPLHRRLRAARREGQLVGDEATALTAASEQGLFSEVEVAQLQAAYAARDRVIQVDAFAHDYWQRS